MLTNLTNFKSLFNNLNSLENFESEIGKAQANTFTPIKEQNEKKLFTPILMPYDFESNNPIGDLFKGVNLDGTVISPKRVSSKISKIDSEAASLITECPPGSKPVGDINVNSKFLTCKPDGTPVKPEPEHKFLSEKNSCVFKSKYKSPNSAVVSTLMPKALNAGTETATEDGDMVTRSGTGSRVLSDLKVKNYRISEKFQVSEKDMVTRSGTGTDVFSDLDKKKSRVIQPVIPKSFKLKEEDEKMVTRSGSGSEVLSNIMSDSGLSTSSLSSSAASSSAKSSSAKSSSVKLDSSGSSSSASSSKKKTKSDVKSYKQAVQKAAKEKYTLTTSDN
jgi:hypothetical protein